MANSCTYIYKRGSKKGQRCKETCHLNYNFCKKHCIKNDNHKIDNQNRMSIDGKIPIIHVYKKIQEDTIKNKILSLNKEFFFLSFYYSLNLKSILFCYKKKY